MRKPTQLAFECDFVLDEHLAKWTPEYCDEVNKHAGAIFYKEIANILKEFILSDYEEFTDTNH